MAEVLGLLAQLPGFTPPQQSPADGARAPAPAPGFATLLIEAPTPVPAPVTVAAATPAAGLPADALGASVLHPVRQVATGHLSYLAHAAPGAERAVARDAAGIATATMPQTFAPGAGGAVSAATPTDATFVDRSAEHATAHAISAAAPAAAHDSDATVVSLAARASAVLGVLFPPRRLQVVARDGELSVRLRDFALDADAQTAMVAALRRALPEHTLVRIVCNGALVWSKEVPCP